jgi:hypothetical protein
MSERLLHSLFSMQLRPFKTSTTLAALPEVGQIPFPPVMITMTFTTPDQVQLLWLTSSAHSMHERFIPSHCTLSGLISIPRYQAYGMIKLSPQPYSGIADWLCSERTLL